ncbi:hypothetical protein LEP1GSC131_2087 [Leptospira kirschneri str. 200802841]|uniref:Uncharacterized protein n=1 Tax=Leptospira kirschneri str. 200802841 TaxID=1193047 RepID=A0A828Y350_9LEPT|nr:hypothetical protein LEP1GSC131_2087 [Leptospira kirschneri str. 200802841]
MKHGRTNKSSRSFNPLPLRTKEETRPFDRKSPGYWFQSASFANKGRNTITT